MGPYSQILGTVLGTLVHVSLNASQINPSQRSGFGMGCGLSPQGFLDMVPSVVEVKRVTTVRTTVQ